MYITYDKERQVTSRLPRYKAAVHVPDFDTLVPAPELSRYNCVVIFLKGLFFASVSDSSEAETSVSKSGT